MILVHGMFGFGPDELGQLSYWDGVMEAPSPLKRYEATVGPISSPHDRACELAAQLKGVRVDYGRIHSTAQGHSRFGRDYDNKGLYEQWDAHHPLHLVGHSLGASTVRALQDLLARDLWGWGSSADWITSITSISGPLGGSTAIYRMGADPRSGLLRRGAGLEPIIRLLELYTALNERWLEHLYDFDLDHWGFSRKRGEDLISYLRRVSTSPFFWGTDNAFYAVSLQSAFRDNRRWATHESTYYFSYVTEMTFRWRPGGPYHPSPLMHLALRPHAYYMGNLEQVPTLLQEGDFDINDWWENDGMVPTYSQQLPRLSGRHLTGGEITSRMEASRLLPGHWYVQWERGFDHVDICQPRPWQRKRQRRFYQDLFERLSQLDSGHQRV